MADTDPTKLSLDDWIVELEIGEAEAARGEGVPLSEVLKSLHESAVRIAARKGAGPLRKVAPRP